MGCMGGKAGQVLGRSGEWSRGCGRWAGQWQEGNGGPAQARFSDGAAWQLFGRARCPERTEAVRGGLGCCFQNKTNRFS